MIFSDFFLIINSSAGRVNLMPDCTFWYINSVYERYILCYNMRVNERVPCAGTIEALY